VLLIQRKNEPYAEMWAIPGGFCNVGESLEQAAQRELTEETGLEDIAMEQLHAFSDPDRDPREHVISVAFYACVILKEHSIKASSDAKNAQWFLLEDLPPLAFDHNKIIDMAFHRIKIQSRFTQ